MVICYRELVEYLLPALSGLLISGIYTGAPP